MDFTYIPLFPDVWKVLCELPRAGWVKRQIPKPETVGTHTILTCALASSASESLSLSREDHRNLLLMLEIHDFPEYKHGDQIILYGVDSSQEARDRARKYEEERGVMQEICTPHGELGGRMLALWERFETGDDFLAKLARECDKAQAIEQAFHYECEYGIRGLGEEFVRYSAPVTIPYLRDRIVQLEQQLVPQ